MVLDSGDILNQLPRVQSRSKLGLLFLETIPSLRFCFVRCLRKLGSLPFLFCFLCFIYSSMVFEQFLSRSINCEAIYAVETLIDPSDVSCQTSLISDQVSRLSLGSLSELALNIHKSDVIMPKPG